MTSAKVEMLAGIREALEDRPTPPPAARNYRYALDRSTDIVSLFVERASEYRATVEVVALSELPAAIARASGGRRLVAPPGIPAAWTARIPTVKDDPPLSTLELDAIDGVITTAALAIALTGTVVLDAGIGQGRRPLSLLPDFHLCVVHAAQIVGTVPEAIARLDPSAPQTWISGPSATSDIELNRVEGVHGPRTLHILVISTPPEPADFDSFWQGLYAQARAVEVAPTMRATGQPGVYDVEFTSLGGLRIGGWLTVPPDGHIERGVVFGHGYGGRDAPEPVPVRGAAAIFPCARGLSRSAQHGMPSSAREHVLFGIDSRESYIHGGCAADIWCAATALTQLAPEAAGRLDYIGESFGGGIGALALAVDHRFHSGALKLPSFGHHPMRLTIPCTGSGEAVRRYHATHPCVADVLAYFDAATAARRIRIPMLIAPARRDPAVPPAGQFAVYDSLAGPKELFVLPTGHLGDTADDYFVAMERFFAG